MSDPTTQNIVPVRLQPKSENEIKASWLGSIDRPLVSICCATYNHALWIEDAICGFLSQETRFPFEIIIRDDASTDGTTDIVKRYASEYPGIIRTVINSTNHLKLGERPSHVWPDLARGEFIALCEGDDYWILIDKLQKQVDLLTQNPEAVMSVARTVTCKIDHKNKLDFMGETPASGKLLLENDDINNTYYHTSTYLIRGSLFRRVIRDYFKRATVFGDTALRAILITHGPFVLYDELVSVYRMTGEGVWSSLDRARQLEWEYKCAKELSKILPCEHAELQKWKAFHLYFEMIKAQFRGGRFRQAVVVVPELFFQVSFRFNKIISRRLPSGLKIFCNKFTARLVKYK